MTEKKIKVTCDGTDYVDYKILVPLQGDLKIISDDNLQKLKNSIIKYGFTAPAFIWKSGKKLYIVDSHSRVKALDSLFADGYEIPDIPIVYIKAKDKKEAKEKLLQITSTYGEFTQDGFADFILDAGLDISDLEIRLANDEFTLTEPETDNESYSLSDLFEANPFSVIDARTGEWQESKNKWLAIIPDSKKGRGDNLINAPEREYGEGTCSHMVSPTSVFDPQLSSVMYKWFCPDGGKILDPFAGGSVRGIVAGLKGYAYMGIDIRSEQVKENLKQLTKVNLSDMSVKPKWICGDSAEILPKISGEFDMLFSCPPYADLEVYSQLEGDISNKEYNVFISMYVDIIKKASTCLKEGGMACFVVGEVRGKDGAYYNFIGDTIKAFLDAGLKYYNEIIFISPNGTAGMRAKRQFTHGRKIVKTHQNILMFVKPRDGVKLVDSDSLKE